MVNVNYKCPNIYHLLPKFAKCCVSNEWHNSPYSCYQSDELKLIHSPE